MVPYFLTGLGQGWPRPGGVSRQLLASNPLGPVGRKDTGEGYKNGGDLAMTPRSRPCEAGCTCAITPT